MKQIELLAPVGDFECLKAAVQNGADSVYLGSNLFSARAAATNFDIDELERAINYCALRNVHTHLALNTLIKDTEFADAVNLARKAYEFGIDALIVQDMGLAKYLMKAFPDLPIHASTQMTIHNLEGVKQLEELGFSRAVLARELSLEEIEYICKNTNLEIETFIHGALCICYSGQCLFSSMVGARSGNRGKCAQPCRLPYTLVEKPANASVKLFAKPHRASSEKVLDSGYILSPKDLCGLEFLPALIEAGVTCFKIEGRLKNPDYVATVTRIYRKYIDKVLNKEDYIIEEQDKKDLMQVFNRGGFSTGHLDSLPNTDLICKEKANNMGLYVGNVANYNKAKGHISLILNEKLAIGDTITFKQEPTKYTISELMVDKSNVPSANVGTKVTIGRMKGRIYIGDKIYKLTSKTLSENAHSSYTNCENCKLPLRCELVIKEGKPITMQVSSYHINHPLYKKMKLTIQSNIIPDVATNTPITKERIIAQISKTKNTPFVFKEIDVDLDGNLHIPSISSLNELRRMALSKVEDFIITNKRRNTNFDMNKWKKYSLSGSSAVKNEEADTSKDISLLLNILNPEFDYTTLDVQNVARIYIPFKYFIDKESYDSILKFFSTHCDMYIYMPPIIRNNYKNVIMHHLEEILQRYNIKGFVVSNVGDFSFLEKYTNSYELIANYTFNVFNSDSLYVYNNLGINRLTLSPESTIDDVEGFSHISIPKEMVVYGNTPVMTTQYCFLGSSNKCYPNCKMKCHTPNKYYLRDRLGLEFRVLPDNLQTISTVYNSKTTSITHIQPDVTSYRVDILDEPIEKINNIIIAALRGEKLEGKQYTYGNLYREV